MKEPEKLDVAEELRRIKSELKALRKACSKIAEHVGRQDPKPGTPTSINDQLKTR